MMTSEMERRYYERKIEELMEENEDLRRILIILGFQVLLLSLVLIF